MQIHDKEYGADVGPENGKYDVHGGFKFPAFPKLWIEAEELSQKPEHPK